MGDVKHLRTKLAPAAQRKRFDRLLERIAEYGDLVGNEGEICRLRDLCEEMFEELYAPARRRVLDSMSKQLRDAVAEYRRENRGG